MSRQQQSLYEDEDEDGYEDTETLHGKQALYVVAYFALLAVFVVVANQFHVATMQAIFCSMMGLGLALALLIWLVKLMVRKVGERMPSVHLSRREIVQYAVGYNPYAAEDIDEDEEGEDEEADRPALPHEVIEPLPPRLSDPGGK